MKQLYIDLRNCYGIGEMNSDIKFGKGKNACVIYAPNGTMKTSFTKTVLDLLENKQPQDKIFKDRATSASIMLDSKPISIDNCYVFNNQKDNGNECLSTLLNACYLYITLISLHRRKVFITIPLSIITFSIRLVR